MHACILLLQGAEKALQTAKRHMETTSGPYAMLVRKRTFTPYRVALPPNALEMNREAAIQVLLPLMDAKDVVVGTTGMLSRELFEERVRLGMSHGGWQPQLGRLCVWVHSEWTRSGPIFG